MTKPIRILGFTAHEADTRSLCAALLDAGLSVAITHVGTASPLPPSGGWDIVLYHDLSPALNSQQVLERVGGYMNDHPVVVISASVGEEVAVELMRRGIADLVLSGQAAARLPPIVRREVAHARERALMRVREQKSRAVLEALGSSRDWREAVEASLARIGLGFGAVEAVMLEMSDPDSLLRPIARWCRAGRDLAEICAGASRLPARQTLVGRAVLSGEPLIVQYPASVTSDADTTRLTASFTERGISGMICQPLQAGGRKFGLSIMFDNPDADLEDINAQFVALAAVLQPALLRRLVEHERDLLRGALDATRSGVLITDAQLDLPGPHIIYANQAVAEMTGHARHELLGDTPRRLQGPDTSRTTLSALREALGNAEPFNTELVNYRKDGSSFLVDLDITPVREYGRVSHFISVQTDVTARRAAEAARLAAEEDLHAAVRLGPGVLYRAQFISSHVRLLIVHGDSLRVEALLGDGFGESASLATLLHEPDNIRLLRGLLVDPAAPEAMVDLRVRWKDGSVRWVRNTMRVSSRGENILEFIGYFLDVTSEKEAEFRQQRSSALSSLGEMATAMAHELNQPLSSISFAAQNAAAQMRREHPDLQKIIEKLDRVASEALRASKLIEHMKLFARNERQLLGPVSWRDIVCKALEILASRLEGVRVQVELADDLPDVMGATIAMEQIMINLLANALDAYGTPAGREVLLVVEGQVAAERVILTVRDRAGGIAVHVLPHIFDPFFTTKEPGKGTGLGLALCYRSVADMGGTLSARNEAGGAAFEISLPIADAGLAANLVAE